METPKFCVDCQHFMDFGVSPEYVRCGFRYALNLVTGEKIYPYCSIERADKVFPEKCGENATNWHPIVDKEEAKPETPF